MNHERVNKKGPKLLVKDLKALLEQVPNDALLHYMLIGNKVAVGQICVDHARHTRMLRPDEPGYVSGLVNETYDTTQPDHVIISFGIINPLDLLRENDGQPG